MVAEFKYILLNIFLISRHLYIIITLLFVTCPQHSIKEKIKRWLARDQNNVGDGATCMLLQCTSTIQNVSKRVGLVQNGHHSRLAE